jgi:REP element-mobilizing transposase RayT
MTSTNTYHLTWHTYGTWLPGDERGWVDKRKPEIQAGSRALRRHAKSLMVQEAVLLTRKQRRIVGHVIRKHCQIRGWTLHALNVLATHLHAVITAPIDPEKARSELKAWCSRRLNENRGAMQEWWAGGGDIEEIGNETYLENAIVYVLEKQEEPPLPDEE